MKIHKKSAHGGQSVHRSALREKGIVLFCLLMATALPALLALICGGRKQAADPLPWEERQVEMLSHEDQSTEVLSFAHVLALSLAATNGADTPADSLAAQCVALRSRGIWWMDYCEEGEDDLSAAAHHRLCDSPAHGLPYLSEEALIALYGKEEAELRLQAGERAVERTRGMVLTYQGELIPALLHHSGTGRTRSIHSLPWLCEVTSPEAREERELRYTAEELRLRLATAFGIEIPRDPWEWSMETIIGQDGWVKSVRIGEHTFTGDEFAMALSLPSVSFTLEADREGLSVNTWGEGSGCGLSRAGAAVYAEGGLTWGEILTHYYPACQLEQII